MGAYQLPSIPPRNAPPGRRKQHEKQTTRIIANDNDPGWRNRLKGLWSSLLFKAFFLFVSGLATGLLFLFL